MLGAILKDEAAMRRAASRLREDDFSTDTNRLIWSAALRMHLSGAPLDALTLAGELRASDELRSYLAQLLEVTVTTANAPEHIELVAETGRNRRLREAIREAGEAMDEQDAGGAAEILEAGMRAYNEEGTRLLLSPTDQLNAFYQYRDRLERGEKTYTRTGFRQLDRLLGNGLKNAGLYFLAARPGVGKTALALNIAEYAAANIGPVCFFSLEMTAPQLLARRLSMEARLDSGILLSEKLTQEEHEELAAAASVLSTRRLLMTEELLPVQRVASIARGCKGVRLVVIDHFTLFPRPQRQPDHAEYAAISHTLAGLAKAIDAPVLCLIQLNRETEQRKGRARLGDLRGSGATEEDAAGVMILHKETDGDPDRKATPRMLRLYLDKNRFGEVGNVAFSFWPARNIFRETYVT